MTSNPKHTDIKTSKIGISGLEEHSRDNIETHLNTSAPSLLSSALPEVTEGNTIRKGESESQLKSDSEESDSVKTFC